MSTTRTSPQPPLLDLAPPAAARRTGSVAGSFAGSTDGSAAGVGGARPGHPSVRDRVAAVLTQLRAALADAAPSTGYQRATYAVAALLMLSGVVHLGVWVADGSAWEGAVSWRKPILFSVSFAMFGLAAGWVQGVLPRSALWGWTSTVLMSGGAVAEVGLIAAQQWRGVASHFNLLTPVDAMIFSLMGVTIAVFGAGLGVLALWTVLRLRRPAPTVIAALVGLALVLVGSALGGDLMTRGLAYVEANDSVPPAVVLGVAGSGKLAHAVALHGLQVLAVLALLLGRSGLDARTRTRAMVCSATGYAALTALVTAHAYAGRSMLDVSLPMAGALAMATLAVLAPFGLALRDAVRG